MHDPLSMDQESDEKHSSRRLGEYLVIKDIAEGTFGKVKSQSASPFERRI